MLNQEFLSALDGLEKSHDPDVLTIYSSDSMLTPSNSARLVLFPSNAADVLKILTACEKYGVSVVPSGGRTGLVGGATPLDGEVLLSLEKMNSIGEVNIDQKTVWVEAGATTRSVHEKCEKGGLYWPIDLASKGSSQVGGNIATNAGGIHVVRYGMLRNWIASIEVAFPNGDLIVFGSELVKDNTGLDLMQLFIGSEGVLGVITRAELFLTEMPRPLMTSIACFDHLETASELLSGSRKLPLALHTFEIMDQESVAIAGGSISSKWCALIEVEENPELNTLNLVAPLSEAAALKEFWLADSEEKRNRFWSWRESISESVKRVVATRGLIQKKMDVSLPYRSLVSFADRVNDEFKENVWIFGHFGDGNLHLNFGFSSVLLADQAEALVFCWIKELNGSISAEHGIGTLKRDEFLKWIDPNELRLMRQVKKVFDPSGILNPGKMI